MQDSLPLQEVEGEGTQNIELVGRESGVADAKRQLADEEDDYNQQGFYAKASWNPAEITVGCCGYKWLQFNWVIMTLSVGVIWSFVIWAASDPKAGTDIGEWQVWIVKNFAWFYSGCMGMFMMFMLYVMISPYGDLKLAASDDEEPDFSYATWFSMLFSAGIAIGIFFFGVGEPIQHFREAVDGQNRWGNLPLNEKATAALNLSWFHWGFSASSVYAIVGLPLALFGHRRKMPMTIRMTFYALIGDDVNGIFGDVLDSVAVIGTMFGVATSLGIGIIQLSTGLKRVAGVQDTLATQLTIMWVVTAVATVSVMTGLKVGIRRLSEVNFLLGLLIVFYLFFAGDSMFLLDLFVQTTGYQVQWMPKLLLRTDAWERVGFNAAQYSQYTQPGNITDPDVWMSYWSTFYWAWWIAWSPFVGLFIASISKGRTVREFILGNMVVPTIMTCVILTVFGGLGLQIDLRSYLNGYTCDANAPMGVIGPNGETSIPANLMRISCRAMADRFFDVLDAFPLPTFMGVISVITMTTYFVTSSDSASHVLDVITSNGLEEPPMIQRVFWALMEGAVASALLVAGGSQSLTALQTASIAAGLPLTFVLIGMMVSAKFALDEEMQGRNRVEMAQPAKTVSHDPQQVLSRSDLNESGGDPMLKDDEPPAEMPLSTDAGPLAAPAQGYELQVQSKVQRDVMATRTWPVSICSVCWSHSVETLMAFFLPCLLQWNTHITTGKYTEPRDRICLGVSVFAPVLLTIIFACLGVVNTGFSALSSICALTFYVLSVRNRAALREIYGVDGSMVSDGGAYCCCYGCAIAQEQELVRAFGAGDA